MKVAVIGSGGREHAIIKKLMESPGCEEIIAIPGNGGIAQDVECVNIGAMDIAEAVSYCKREEVDYVVVTPDDPLAAGMVDALYAVGIPAFGPDESAARIESSKGFAKELMRKYRIPTAAFEIFDNLDAALYYVRAKHTYPIVIKADGLALGKGVRICEDEADAMAALRDMMERKVYGESGARVVVEEFLTGPEVSVLAFCDGETVVPMVSSMDHKRIYDGDQGPNTGGMGAVAPNPFYTPEIAGRCMKEIFQPTVDAMRAEKAPFRGCLYFGLILTAKGPYVIEYNCRFGDPETQVVLPLIEGDLLEIMLACTKGNLHADMFTIKPESAACVVMASGGYPGAYQTGKPILGLEDTDALVYHAGTAEKDGELVTAGGRVLGVTALAPSLRDALIKAYQAVGGISFEDAYYRYDIGKRALSAEKN